MRVDSTAQPQGLLKECTSVAKSSISGVLGKCLPGMVPVPLAVVKHVRHRVV